MASADAVLPDDGSDRPPGARCELHPQRSASIECPGCGSFACGECTVDTLWGDVICAACQRRGRSHYPLPFEQALTPVAFIHSAYLVFAETGPLFGALPAGRTRRAVLFAALLAVTTGSAAGLTQWLFEPRHWAASAPSLPRALGLHVLAQLGSNAVVIVLTAACFHATAIGLGGRAPWSTALRGVCYAFAAQLLASAGAVADTLVGGNTFSIVLTLPALFFVGWALCVLAEQRYALSRARAIAAGCAPVAGLFAIAVLVLALQQFLGR